MFRCNNFGHKSYDFRSKMMFVVQYVIDNALTSHEKEYIKVWKRKPKKQKIEECELTFHAQNNIRQW